jgi:hypothetical protein
MNKLVIAPMKELAGTRGVKVADLGIPESEVEEMQVDSPDTHVPTTLLTGMTNKEAAIAFDEVLDLPELVGHEDDDDSVSESGETVNDYDDFPDDDEDPEDRARFEEELQAMEEQENIFQSDSSGSSALTDDRWIPVRRTTRENVGVQRYDDNDEWNLMNLSVGAAVRNFVDTALEACKAELVQLFVEKRAIVPVEWKNLSETQKKKVVRSHVFLQEKYKDEKFIKITERIVADGRMQDRTIYTDYSSPTAKTRSVMTCLKLAAVQG